MDDDPIPISLVANYMFCPRRAWLEAVGEKVDSDQIMRGTYDHRKVDRTGGAPDADSFQAVNIRHEEWGVSGKLDTAKMTDDGIVIREYKATPVKRAMIVTEAMRTQLALQAACLEDMGFHVAGTEIFFTTHHRRVDVELDEDDFINAHKAVEATRTLINSEQAPEPLEDSARCMRCSHVGICLPEERKLCAVTHRVMVSSPDNQVTHLATPGAKAFTRSGRMIVQKDGEELASIPIDTMQGLQIYGNTDLSSGLIRELMWRDIPIVCAAGRDACMDGVFHHMGRMESSASINMWLRMKDDSDSPVNSSLRKYTINPFSCDVRNQIIRFYRSYVVLRNKSAMRIVGRMCLGSRGSLRHYISHSLGTSSK